MDREYQRLLDRDNSSFAFLYKSAFPVSSFLHEWFNLNHVTGFRRDWGTFESTYLLAKLSTLLIIALIDPDNCLFRTLSREHLSVVRQILLLIAMAAFFLVQCLFAPFLDPVNNASEFTSRINYVATAALSLGVALDIPGQAVLNGPLLYMYVALVLHLHFC